MLKTHLILTLRYLLKNKVYTLINIISLSVAIACTLVIYLYVKEELSYDKHHKDGAHVYRVITASLEDDDMSRASTYPLYEVLKNDISQIKDVTPIYNQGILIWVEENGNRKKFEESDACVFVTSDYFDILTVDWLIKDPTPLQDPTEVVLSESYATKLFGEPAEALGQAIIFDKKHEYIVSGVFNDHEKLTDFKFHLLGAYEGIKDDVADDQWRAFSTNIQFMVKLFSEADTATVHNQLLQAAQQNISDWEYGKTTFFLQPLADIHHNPRLSNFSDREVPLKSLYIFGSIAFFLIIVACINYINLATALAANRNKEVGIKKAIGSSRGQIIAQFLSETGFIIIVSVLFGIIIAEIFIYLFAGSFNLTFDTLSLIQWEVFAFLAALVFILTLLSGMYPALVMSATSAVDMFRFRGNKKSGINVLRKGMVLFQFLIAQLMILSTIVIFQQNTYFKNKELGFAVENILTVNLPQTSREQRQMIRHEWQQIPGVEKISFAYSSPTSGNVWINNVGLPEMESHEYINADIKLVDKNYLDLYELELLAGRNLHNSDSISEVIINEMLARKLGFENPLEAVGNMLRIFSQEIPIVGVVENFHSRSLKNELVPTLLVNRFDFLNLANIKINMQNFEGGIEKIQSSFDQIFPDDIMHYDYLEESLAEFYERENTTSKIFNIFAIIALLINLSGLYGLISFVALQKTKEVGVRKVLGARTSQIITLLSKEFIVLVLLAFVVAAPIGYYLMQQWLNEFVYKIEISAMFFIIALATSGLLAWVIVGLRAYRTAASNPADVLRDE
jgi:putative ABC transport system permease protein